jgi:hypothetical protein
MNAIATTDRIRVGKSILDAGADVIAGLQIGPRIKDGDSEIAAGDLDGIHYESDVNWQRALKNAFQADEVFGKMTAEEIGSYSNRVRRRAIIAQMVDRYLSNRRKQK